MHWHCAARGRTDGPRWGMPKWPTSSCCPTGVGSGWPAARAITARRADSYDGTGRLGAITVTDRAGEPLPGACSEVLDELAARAAVLVAADLVGLAREANSTAPLKQLMSVAD